MPRLTKREQMGLAEIEYYKNAEEYVKNYPTELMKVLEDVSNLRGYFTLLIKDGIFQIDMIHLHRSFYLTPTCADSVWDSRDPYNQYRCHDLEDLKYYLETWKNKAAAERIKQDKIQVALKKLTKEEKELLEIL